ncbi:C40 family peptidase [Paludifilum halophilum]|uniref:NlpC/P60 domain-containing protein n=1 Tax=Paludifilum halophilum TaxID=1642702 RepID=A0A235B3R5_9BACL|nr:C40 family peptidase [Paludifilum halophilum]OYD06903.1 hypothetical protein CHM34_13255 [Paludifilum halophilum]
MRNSKLFQKVLAASTALLLVGTAAPIAGQANAASDADADRKVQSIFERVGLQSPISLDRVEASPDEVEESNDSSDSQTPETPEQPESTNSGDTTDQTDSSFGDQLIQTGEKYMGTPYKFGASSNTTKVFDCSSFTQRVFKENGVDLPRSSRQQAKVGTTVSKSELQKGDLLFFKLRSSNGEIGHVGIYAGDGKILHTWGPGGVRYDDLSDGWLEWGYVKAKRVTPAN